MSTRITPEVASKHKLDPKGGPIIGFVTKLKCDTPTALSQKVIAEAMINPCLEVEEAADLYDKKIDSSDLAEENPLPIDEDFHDDPEAFSGEEIDESDHGDHYLSYALSKQEPVEVVEDVLNEDEMKELLEETSKSKTSHEEFREELDRVYQHSNYSLSGLEPFLSIRKRTQGLDIKVSDLPGIVRISLNEELRKIMKDKYKEALELITAVNTHREIIQKMAHVLTNRQQEFFNAPDYRRASLALKPFSQTDMAEAIGLHKSTISRIVQGKIVETDFGYVSLQALFGRGKSLTPSKVKLQMLKAFIAEMKTMPTDPEIQTFFNTKGIKMSLEMVRYYRKRLGIHKKRGRRK